MPPTWPRDYRVTAAIVAAALVALGWAEARVRSVAQAQAVEVIAADRDQFKAAALAAARDAAGQAVREAVLPVMVEVKQHRAQDEQAQRENERRLEELERRGRR